MTIDLYRHFDGDGVLLYAGISLSALARLVQHRRGAHWYRDIASVRIEKFPTREAAQAAEKIAIENEKPLFNIQYSLEQKEAQQEGIMIEPYLPLVSANNGNGWTIDEASNNSLLRQAPMTANEYILSAIDHIDQKLGKSYAKQHPELIGAFMHAAAMDFGAAVIARAIESITNSINANFDGIVEASRSDHPLQGESLSTIGDALNCIAEAITNTASGFGDD